MKKLLSLILALVLLASVVLTSCGKKEESGKTDGTKVESTAKKDAHGKCKDGKAHSFTTTKAEADCTSRGYTLNTCKACSYAYLSETKAALGHDFGDEVAIVPLGCTTDGKVKKICKRCGACDESVLPHTGHSYELSSEENVDGEVYVCTVCGDRVTLAEGEDLPVEKEESVYLPDRPCDFTFAVLCDSEDILRGALSISGDGGNEEYKIKSDGDGRYLVSPKNNYAEYGSYTAYLTDAASFENYNTDTLEFSIVGPDRADVEFKDDDIVFLKKLSEKNKGYPLQTLEWDEAAEMYYVTLSGSVGIDDSYFGKVFAVGDYVSTEDVMKDPTRELVFGKLTGVTRNAKGKTVLEMTAPEISDVFSEYDLYFSGGADSAEPLTLLTSDEELELEFAEAVVMSDGFAEYMATVQLAAGDYADDHGLEIVPLGSKGNNKFEFELTDKTFNVLDSGNGVKLKLGGKLTYTIDLKNKYKNLNAGSVTVTCSAVVESIVSIGGDFKEDESVDLSVQDTTTATLGFSVQFKLDYSKDYEEKYYVHSNTKKIHTSSCRVVTDQADKDKLTAYTAEELANMYKGDKAEMVKNECKICFAVTALDGTGYILNKDSKVLHCMNCMHVKTMKNSNIYTVYPANTTGFTTCKNCKPEERQMKDFEARMFNKLRGGNMADELDSFKKSTEEIFGKSKADDTSGYALSIPINICGVMNIELGVKPVFEFEIEASVDFSVTARSSTTFGVRSKGKNGGFETYRSEEKPTLSYELSFMGEADAKIGLGLFVKAYPVGFENAAVIQITGKVGVYGHLTGVFSTSGVVGEDNDTYCAARLDVGIFFDVDGYWKILWFDGDFTIVDDKRFSLMNWGYDRVYYSFVDEETELDMGNSQSFELDDYCKANYIDLSTMEKKAGYITERDLGRFKINVECKNEDGSSCNYLKFTGKTWTVDRTAAAPDSFTAYVYVTFESRTEIASIGDFFDSQKYDTIYAYSLDPLVIKVTADKCEDVPGQPVTEPNQTITVPKGGKTIGMGGKHISALKTDGTVVTINSELYHDPIDTSAWTDIVAISTNSTCTVGLKSDGTVVYDGKVNIYFDVSDWTDIVSISLGERHLAGLKADGTVVTTGASLYEPYDKFYNTNSWENISQIYCTGDNTVGIKNDGSVLIVGSTSKHWDVSKWTDIVCVSGCASLAPYTSYQLIGVKSDGTVVATGTPAAIIVGSYTWPDDLLSWQNIVSVYTLSSYNIGLKSDGTLIIVGGTGSINELSTHNNIVDVICDPLSNVFSYSAGLLKSDGTLEFTRISYYSAEDLSLLHDIALPTR